MKPPAPSGYPHCHFKDIALDDGRCATVLLENPAGCSRVEEGGAEEFARKLFC